MMKNMIPLMVVCVSLGAANAARADQKLAESKACLACHATDQKKIGPAFKDVAAKYAKDKDAAIKLATSIKAGGAGKWGPIPMPAQAALSEADAKALAGWVLSIK
jgi:cytochrome c